MKIAEICRSIIRPAGTERVVLETSQELQNRGHDVRIFTSRAQGALFKIMFSEIFTENLSIASSPMFHLYADLFIAKRLIDLASTWADVVVLHHGHAMAAYAWQRYGIPCIPFYHTNNNLDWSLYGLFRLVAPAYTMPLRIMESNCLATIPVAFANSRNLMLQVEGYAKRGKFVVVPLGVNVDKFCPSNEDEGFILTAGRYDPTNNFELAIKAVAGTPHRLVIAGVRDSSHERYARRLKGMVNASSSLRHQVQFATLQEDELVDHFRRCSVFLSPRKYGYLGLASLEAMACAKPVVAFDPGREIEDSPPVIKCSGSSDEWRSTLSRLMENHDWRDSLGDKSLRFIENNHTWPKSVDTILRALQALESEFCSQRLE